MKLLLLFTFICLIYVVKSGENENSDLLIKGIIQGIWDEAPAEPVGCTNYGDYIMKKARKAMGFWTKDKQHKIRRGIRELGFAIKDIPDRVKNCRDLFLLVRGFGMMGEHWRHPEELDVQGSVFNWHGVDIHDDVKAAVKGFDNHDFEEGGKHIGAIIGNLYRDELFKPVHLDTEENDKTSFIEDELKD